MANDDRERLARTIFLNGTVGSGKTSTASAIGAVLEARRVPHAIIDIDAVTLRWPKPPDDPFDFRLTLANTISVITNYRDAGARIIVAAGVIETLQQYHEYERGFGDVVFSHVMLEAPSAVVAQRLQARHADPAELDWHLRRAPELASLLASAGLPGPTVNADQPLQDVAQSIVQALLGP